MLCMRCIKLAFVLVQLQLSAGGLVSALSGVQGFDTMWVGWPGEALRDAVYLCV